MGGAALARGDSADHLGSVGDRLFGMEGALGAGEALTDDPGIAIDQNRHDLSRLFHCVDDFFRRIRQIVRRHDRQA
jgi:hypothetical protein